MTPPRLLPRLALLGASLLGMALLTAPVAAAEEAPEEDAEEKKDLDPDAGVARPEADDLRTGHLFIRAGGGLLAPSSPTIPSFPDLSSLGASGGFNATVGIGLNRYLVLNADAGLALFPESSDTCDGCGATSIDAGLDLAFHVNQGFALDPWVSYGMGYRHTIVAVSSEPEDVVLHAFEFTRLGFGADYYPVSSFGFGPYMEVDVGVRDLDNPTAYAIFQLGMRLSFDPFAIGTSFSPGAETASR